MAPLNPQAPLFIPTVDSSPAPLALPSWFPVSYSFSAPYSFPVPQPVPDFSTLPLCCYYQGLPLQSRLAPISSFIRLSHCFPTAGVEFLGLPWPSPSISPNAFPPLPAYPVAVPVLCSPVRCEEKKLLAPPIYAGKPNVVLEVLPKENHHRKDSMPPPPSPPSPPPPPLRAVILRKRRVRIGPRLKMKVDSMVGRPRRQLRPSLNVKVGSFWLPRLRCFRKKCPEDEKLRAHLQFNEATGEDENRDLRTTVMIKNLPNKLRKDDLLALLDSHCVEENKATPRGPVQNPSQFDFFYLPMDFGTGSNLGYAFVNFTNSEGAWRLHRAFHTMKWDFLGSKKICEITYARIQGMSSLVKHFRCSVFVCDDEELLPLYFVPFRDGVSRNEGHHVGQRVPHDIYERQ